MTGPVRDWRTIANNLAASTGRLKRELAEARALVADAENAMVDAHAVNRAGKASLVASEQQRDRLAADGSQLANALESVCRLGGPAPSRHDFELAQAWRQALAGGEGDKHTSEIPSEANQERTDESD